MARHEAVDRLMALATEGRATRIAGEAQPGRDQTQSQVEAGSMPRAGAVAPAETAADARPGAVTHSGAVGGGRQLLKTILPLLPALGGWMQMVDHGAVQAAARLLLLLGGKANGAAVQAAVSAEQERSTRARDELRAWQEAMDRKVEGLSFQVAAVEELLGTVRAQQRRLSTDLLSRETELRSLGERVRLLSAGFIILLMLILAQMILLVVILRK